jgi:MerR family copper efflux transcriptional regulator
MQIGEVATKANVSIQTLRYYERRGLLSPAQRKASGFRVYDADVVKRVRFIRRAKDLGFTLEEIGSLLALWEDSSASCEAVEQRTRVALERIDVMVHDLTRMQGALKKYANACQQKRTLKTCPLLHELGGPEESTP